MYCIITMFITIHNKKGEITWPRKIPLTAIKMVCFYSTYSVGINH